MEESAKAGSKRKRAEDEAIDLCNDDDSEPTASPANQQNKRPRTEEKAAKLSPQHTPRNTLQASPEAAPPTQLPTPENTPQKPKSLYDYPELAEQHIHKISHLEGVEITNPRKFSLRPAFWKKWRPSEYRALIEEVETQFDPTPLSRKIDRPVNEIKHVFNAVFANSLYDWEQAAKRGEEGMKELFAQMNDQASLTSSRRWGPNKDGRHVFGKLREVETDLVKIEGEKSGNVYDLGMDELSDADKKYLKCELMEGDKEKLWKALKDVEE